MRLDGRTVPVLIIDIWGQEAWAHLFSRGINEDTASRAPCRMEWTQADLAERLGVSGQTINAIETGKYESSLPLTIRIARLSGKAVEEVFLLDVGPPRNGSVRARSLP